MPAEPADLEAGGKKPGAGESIVFGIEHAVKSKVVEAFLGLVTAAVPVSVEMRPVASMKTLVSYVKER